MKTPNPKAAGMILLLPLLLWGCDRPAADVSSPVIAVSSSYLECAVRDLLGADLPVLRLAEPGMCPGHFDIRPGQVQQLRACRILFRFEFQGSLDRQLDPARCSAVQITTSGGMCEPETYLAACRQVANGLVAASLMDEAAAQSKLGAIRSRVRETAEDAARQIEAAGLKDAPVIASGHQAAFCRWLGLRVVAVIGGADVASVRHVDTALSLARQANCRIVIANRPEGTQLAQSIADRLEAGLVVFDNFPTLSPTQPDFDGLLLENVQRLIKTRRP